MDDGLAARMVANNSSVMECARQMASLSDGIKQKLSCRSTCASGEIPRLSRSSASKSSSVVPSSSGSRLASACWRISSGLETSSFHCLKLLSPTRYSRKPRSSGTLRDASLSARSARILAPARRMRSRAMSAMVR